MTLSGMTRAEDIFGGKNADAQAKKAKDWLETKGIVDLPMLPLMAEELDRVYYSLFAHLMFHCLQGTVRALESLSDELVRARQSLVIRKAVIRGIPPQAVLKPNHAMFKLQEQHFALGDRVAMVQDTGGVPLGAKGVVVGLLAKTMEVLWDNSFISGTNLAGR